MKGKSSQIARTLVVLLLVVGVLVSGIVACVSIAGRSGSPVEASVSGSLDLSALPLVETPAAGSGSDLFAVLLSGDRGWWGLDQGLADSLAQQGIPVVGLDSLRYFWSARTPEETAADVDRIIRGYLARWHKQRFLLMGYSQGADVLPFIESRLTPRTRKAIAFTVLIGAGMHAQFEFHLAHWFHEIDTGLAILPEAIRLPTESTVCIYGGRESNSLCPALGAAGFDVVEMSGGHHFKDDYAGLGEEILKRAHPTELTRQIDL